MRQKVKRYSRSAISILLTLCMIMSCMTVGIIATDAAQVDSDSVGASYYILMSTSDDIPSWGASQWIDVPVTQSGSKFTATIPRAKFSSVGGLTTGKNYFLCISNSKSGSGAFFDSESVTSSVSGTKFSANAIQEKDTKRAVRFSMASVDGVEAVVVTVTANSSTRNYALSTTGSTETKYGVTVTAQTGGSVVAGSTAIAAGKSTTVQVSNTNAMTFTATPASGYSFGGWTMTGGVTLTSGTASDTTIKAKATAAGTLTANFTKNAVQTRVVYYDNSQTNWTTPYAQAYTGSTQYLGAAPGTAMTLFDADNKVWAINVPVDATTIVFSDNGSNGCSPQTIPTGYTGPEFYDYTGSGSGGSWQKYTSPLLDNEKNATLATETANNKDLYTNINATFFDYFTDSEVNGSWYSSIDSLKDGWVPTTAGRTNTAYWNQIRRDPYTIFNQQLSAYANNNTVTNPFYFGAFNEDGYRNPGYYRSGMLENGDLINDSNTLGENRTTGNNSKALPGLAADTLTAGNIYYKSGEKMELFDKEWLLTRTTGTRTPFANRIYFDPGQFNQHDSKYDSWSDNGAKFRILQYSGSDWWDNKYLNYDTNIGIYYFDLHDSCQKFKICRQNPSNNGTFDSSNGTVNNGWNSIEINTTAANAKGKLYRITGWNNYSTIDFNGAYSNYGYDKALAEIVNSKFPVRKTTQDNHDYYEFNSTDATDNIYFTNLTDNVLELNYGAGKGYGVKNGYNEGYGFFPFDKNDSGNTSSSVYGKDLAFGMKLEINFTLGANGQIMGTDNNLHDQKFNFSGDDDLWVFIDDQLVLDLGGDHAKTTGSINFHDRSLTYSPDPNTTLGSKKTTFTINNDDTSKVHKMTLFYLERGMQESNLKFGFSFIPVANQFVATESLSTEGINEGLKSVVETAAANDKITVKHETAKAENGSYSAAQNKTYKLEGDDNNHSTGNTGTYNLGNGDKATFVAQFDDGEGDDEPSSSPQPDYFKLTTTSASGNVFKYNTVLTSVTDLVMEQHVTQLGTDNNIFKFRSLKNPKNSLDATDIQADFVSTISTKNLIISKSILGYSDPDKEFTVHVQLDIDGNGTTFTDTNYALKYIKNGVESTMTAAGTFTLKQDEVAIIQGIPEGAKVKISEDVASLSNPHYQHLSTEVLNNNAQTLVSATNGAVAVFVLDDDAMAEITNKPRLQDITVTKQTDVDDYDSEFKIKIETSSDNSEWTAKTGTLYGNNHNNAPIERTDTGGFYTVHKGDTLFIRNIPEDNYVRVTESKPTSANYDFSKSEVTVDGRDVTTGELADATFKQGSDANNVFGWYQVKAANNNVIVANAVQKHKVKVWKQTDTNDGSTFTMNVKKVAFGTTEDPANMANAAFSSKTVTADGLDANGNVTMNSGEYFELEVNKGDTIYVTETNAGHYALDKVTNTGQTDNIANYPSTGTKTGYYVTVNNDVDITFHNNRMLQNFTITKKIDMATASGGTFVFTVKLNGNLIPNTYQYKIGDGAATNFSDGTVTITGVKNDTTITVLDVPVGANVEVYESNPGSGYSLNNVSFTSGANVGNATVDNNKHATFTVTKGTTHAIEVTNWKKQTVTITKKLIDTDTDVDDPSTAFEFKIQVNGVLYTSQASIDDVAYNPVNGVYAIKRNQTLTLNNIDRGAVVNVVEINHHDDYYQYDSTTVRDASSSAPDAIDGKTDGAKFTVGTENVAVEVKNKARRVNVIVKKTTDFPDDDGSLFTVTVKSRQRNSTKDYTLNNTGVVTGGVSEHTNGEYRLYKDGYITFANVPKGTFFEVNETSKGTSDVTHGERFTLNNVRAYPTSTESDPQYIRIKDSDHPEQTTDVLTGNGIPITVDTTFIVSNKVKRNDLIISKNIVDSNDDTTTTHELTIHMLRNGVNSTPCTDLKYQTRANASAAWGTEQAFTNGGKINIVHGQQIRFQKLPVGTYVTITEREINGNYTFSNFVVENAVDVSNLNTRTVSFMTADMNGATNVVVHNKLQRFKLEVTKLTNSNVTDTFKVKVLTSNALNGTYTENAFTQAGQFTISGLADDAAFAKYSSETKEISLTKGQTLTVNNLAINTYVKVVESSTGTYHEWQSYSADTGVIKNTPASAADGAIVQMTANRALTINNKIKTKNVEIKKITDFRSDDVDFNFTVSIKREGEAANDNITTYKYTPNGAITGTEGTTAFGTDGKFALRKDGTIVIYNVPVRATVTVTEATPGNGYSFNKTQSTGAEFTDEGVATLTVPSDSNPTVTFANTKDKTVTIKKTTDWNNTADEFTFNVKKGTANYSGTAGTSYKVFNGSNEEQTRTFNADGNITLKKDEYVVIYGVKTGDKFTVHETENARYTLASVTGVVSSDNTEFTIADDNVSLTYLNEIKKNDVTIQKIINNSDDNETEFPLSIKVTKVENDPANQTFELKNGNQKVADISEGTALTTAKIKRSETLTIKDVPIGYTVEVIETDAQTGSFEFDSIEVVNNTAETSTIDANARKALLTTKNTVAQVKITNKPIIRDIEITKSVDNGTGTFYVVVQLGNGYATSYQKKSTDNYGTTQTVGDDHKIAIQPGETIKISGVAKNTQVTVQEVDIDSDFVYVQSTVSGATGTELSGDNHGTEFTMGSENVTVNIQNKEDIKYQFEIKYIYEAYSATTYNNKTDKDEAHRVFGVDRSYTQSGRISKDDLNTYFNKASDGSLSIKSDKRKDFINKFAPYEDDFMLNLVWDDLNPKEATYDVSTKTIRLETTARSAPDRTVNVYFKLPYEVDETTLEPSSETPEKKTAEQHAKTTQYGNWVTTNNEYKDEEAADFVTAPLTLANGEHFQYWKITSATTTKRDTAVESKRCYYDQFNMTMYQDCYVEPVYAESPTDFDPSARSYADTVNGEAIISFIENSRNQWNNDGGGTEMTGDKLKAGDRIYSDFLLTFGYKDRLLNSANNGGVEAAGFVLEQVAELDKEGDKYVTKSASEYAEEYKNTVDKEKVKNYLNSEAQAENGFVNKSMIDLNSLDNKNQTKYSFSIKNKAYGNLEEGNAKKYVYRAYSYLKVGNDIVVSDPVYFTIYDMASIELGQTNAQGGQS